MYKQIILFFFLTYSFLGWTSPVPDFLARQVVPNSKYDNGYPEDRFHQVLETVFRVVEPLVLQRGGQLRFIKDWSDGAVNMWAGRAGDEYWVEVPGGFSRYHLINEEAFLLTLCHELGHLLGGEPMSHDISYEGQSDYWSTEICAQKVFRAIISFRKLPENAEVRKLCERATGDSYCYRTVMGSLSVTSYFAEILNQPFPMISEKDSKVVNETMQRHPSPQCRLDTLLAGHLQLLRPVCWFRP